MFSNEIHIPDTAATEACAARMALANVAGGVIYLEGELGAGKTTLVRGWLRALGYDGAVRSPTYTLLETYDLTRGRVLHLDLYRLRDAEEVHYLGLGDALEASAIVFIEWPSLGRGYLPQPDLILSLDYATSGRTFRFDAKTAAGQAWANAAQSVS